MNTTSNLNTTEEAQVEGLVYIDDLAKGVQRV